MRNIATTFISILIWSCSFSEKLQTVDVDEIIKESSSFDGDELHIRTYLEMRNNGAMVLYSEDSRNYLDVVYVGENNFNLDAQQGQKYCVRIEGIYQEYNSTFVGLGNLTSKYGIVEAKIIVFCEDEVVIPPKNRSSYK